MQAWAKYLLYVHMIPKYLDESLYLELKNILSMKSKLKCLQVSPITLCRI